MRADTYQTWYVPKPSSMAGTLSLPSTSVAVSQWYCNTCQKLLNVCSFQQSTSAAQGCRFILCKKYWSNSKLYLQLYRHRILLPEVPGSIKSNTLDIYASYCFLLSDKFPILDDIIAPQLNHQAFSKIKFPPQIR